MVVGGGGHAKVVVSVLRKLGSYRILGYTDLNDRGAVLGARWLGSDDTLASLARDSKSLHCALGLGQVGLGNARRELWERLQPYRMMFPHLISPDAVVNSEVAVGQGTVVFDGAVVNPGVRLGSGVIVNTNSTIEHDVIVEDWVHIGPGATISGGSRIGAFSMIGAGAVVIEGRNIVDGCFVGAGATVISDLREPGVYVGCPARRIR